MAGHPQCEDAVPTRLGACGSVQMPDFGASRHDGAVAPVGGRYSRFRVSPTVSLPPIDATIHPASHLLLDESGRNSRSRSCNENLLSGL